MERKILSVLLLSMMQTLAFADEKELLEDIQVTESQIENDDIVKLLPENSQSIVDTPDVLKKIAGADVNRNGPLTGIAQYRGLFGSRVNVQIDNTQMQESCSNSMDTAMSHIPAGMVDAVILKRGIAPVSSAIESIGGSISVVGKEVKRTSETLELSGDLNLGYSSVNSGKKTAVMLNAASEKHGFYLGIDSENGDSYNFANGTNYNTEYDRDFYMMGYNFHNDNQVLKAKLNYNNTGNTGTPSLPMDIVYAKGGVASLEYGYQISEALSINSQLSHQNTDHLMSNYLFRSVIDKRDSLTQVNSNSYSIQADSKHDFGDFSFGIEGDFTSHQANITNPENAMFQITNFDTKKYRNSVFVEMHSDISKAVNMTGGLRYTFVDMSAADVYSSVSMMQNMMGIMHKTLQDRFNSADRNILDKNLDIALSLQHQISDSLSFEYAIARKTRSPSYQERYLWLPLEATAGMADGLQYFGNLELSPEVATQFELGMSYQSDSFSFAPHVFYHDVKDYIQGTPTTTMPAPANTLTFNNVDAKLYGVDLELTYKLTDNLTLNNVTAYVRGERQDIDDNLYRIAPLNTRVELVYSRKNWNIKSEAVAYQSQERVSVTNNEQATAGYGLFNLSASYKFNQRADIAFGVNNLFDKIYYNHLNGYNRNNLNIDIGLDATNLQAYRLPGEGRNLFVNLYLHW